MSFVVQGQMSEYYKRKIAESFGLVNGTGVGLAVKITDTVPGGMWFQTTANIASGVPVRLAIHNTWLVPTGSTSTLDSSLLWTRYDEDTSRQGGLRGVLYSEVITVAGGVLDTNDFRANSLLWYPEKIIGISKGCKIDSIRAIAIGEGCNVQFKIYHGKTRRSPLWVAVDSTAFTLSGTAARTTGITWDSGFETNILEANEWIWVVPVTATVIPKKVYVFIYGIRYSI